MKTIDLANKTALITGASQGLGKAFAQTLHAAGASVVVNYFDQEQNRANAQRIVAELGGRAMAVPADVREPEQIAAAFDHLVTQMGPVDIVVNNAGIIRDRTLAKMTASEWQQVIDTNLTGVFNVCKAAVSRINDGGRIVNLSSISAMIGPFGQANYAAAKAGVVSLTKVLSRELAKRSVTVNAVAPGVVLTEMAKSIPADVQTQMINQIPLARFGTPDEIANVVLFLCSDLASYVTGQTIHVNGGWWG